ncbi:MAG: hypothetical protein COU72_01755 [Parcubacteria group bacterium CG10_big_fil_rev_8_21_14_0_10_41_35]|nr:MAG: hypothetical protein COU72_01755 [Parcubacteria group bacterium CG10_big_fil_rev_8_21_14_0_10_41_35]
MFSPKYSITTTIVKMLTAIAESKAVIERAKILPKQELNLRRQAIIRMTHSSTAIEGNMLNMDQVKKLYENKKIDAPDRDTYEARNYLKAIQYISKIADNNQDITEKTLLKIHKLVTKKTLPEESSGKYRTRPVYIVRRRFGMVQEVVYTGPSPKKVEKMCFDLIEWIKHSEKEEISPIIVAGIAHQEIAAIHPFADGNGRTARALSTLILYKRGYDFRQLFALEDYYNEDRQEYYNAINIGKTYEQRKVDFTFWLEYFVKGFKEEIDDVKLKVLQLSSKKVSQKNDSKVYLTERQRKILDFLDINNQITTKDAEDILSAPKRTAQMELLKLKKLGTIKQIGKGPSSKYILK